MRKELCRFQERLLTQSKPAERRDWRHRTLSKPAWASVCRGEWRRRIHGGGNDSRHWLGLIPVR